VTLTEARRRWLVQRLRILAGRAPGQAITKETWDALGYGADGHQQRPLTQDAIGAHPHPRPTNNEGPQT
jgi:hypothetical protein